MFSCAAKSKSFSDTTKYSISGSYANELARPPADGVVCNAACGFVELPPCCEPGFSRYAPDYGGNGVACHRPVEISLVQVQSRDEGADGAVSKGAVQVKPVIPVQVIGCIDFEVFPAVVIAPEKG